MPPWPSMSPGIYISHFHFPHFLPFRRIATISLRYYINLLTWDWGSALSKFRCIRTFNSGTLREAIMIHHLVPAGNRRAVSDLLLHPIASSGTNTQEVKCHCQHSTALRGYETAGAEHMRGNSRVLSGCPSTHAPAIFFFVS